MLSRRIAIGGGSHFRVLPRSFVTSAARRADGRGESLVFYFHPYEFTRRFLFLRGGLYRNRQVLKLVALHNFATRRVESTLRALGESLRFRPLRELATSQRS
jgi:hypothetical protein